jgi:hypothetical protein
VELRHHPLISYRGLSSWPPAWLWRGGDSKKEVRGEVGILKEVISSIISPEDRFFLIVKHEKSEYIGCLIISDPSFCRQISKLIRAHRGYTIEHIGGLDLSPSL